VLATPWLRTTLQLVSVRPVHSFTRVPVIVSKIAIAWDCKGRFVAELRVTEDPGARFVALVFSEMV
jgi:hypothetical protein